MDTIKIEHLEKLTSDLLEVAQGDDCITFALLNKLIPDNIREPAVIEAVFDFLQAHNIKIITGNKYWPDDKKIH